MSREQPPSRTESKAEEELRIPKQAILSFEEYRDTPFANAEDERKYAYCVEAAGKSIHVFGTAHLHEPGDPLFDEIERALYDAHPDIVLVEGKRYLNEHKDRVRAHLQQEDVAHLYEEGESIVALKHAVELGADFESPEPDLQEEVARILSEGFTPRDVFTYYAYRSIAQYLREHTDPRVEECRAHLSLELKEFRRKSGWDEQVLHELEATLLDELDINDRTRYETQSDPVPWEGVPQALVNGVARASCQVRDEHILERVAELMKTYDRLFILYGSAHAVRLEPAIRQLIEERAEQT